MQISEIKKFIEKTLDENKAQNISTIDLRKKSYIADYMIVASGTSSRHLQALSEILLTKLKKNGVENCRIEGKDSKDWKLVFTFFTQIKENFTTLKKCGQNRYLNKKQ